MPLSTLLCGSSGCPEIREEANQPTDITFPKVYPLTRKMFVSPRLVSTMEVDQNTFNRGNEHLETRSFQIKKITILVKQFSKFSRESVCRTIKFYLPPYLSSELLF